MKNPSGKIQNKVIFHKYLVLNLVCEILMPFLKLRDRDFSELPLVVGAQG